MYMRIEHDDVAVVIDGMLLWGYSRMHYTMHLPERRGNCGHTLWHGNSQNRPPLVKVDAR